MRKAGRDKGTQQRRDEGNRAATVRERTRRSTEAPTGRAFACALSLSLLAGLVGCTGPRKFQPEINHETLDQTRFVHYLATLPVVTVDEAARAMLILADGTETHATYEQRVAELEQRGIVRKAWHLKPDYVLDKGTLAFMLFKICRMPGGVDTLLFGSWGLGDRRYALKEVADAGLLTHGPDYQPVTGGELVAALARADSYMAEHGIYGSPEPRVDSPADLTAQPAPGVR
jgi:hypothetical protein